MLPSLNVMLQKATVSYRRKGVRHKLNKYDEMKREVESNLALLYKSERVPVFKMPVCMHYLWIQPSRRWDRSNVVVGRKFIEDSLISSGRISNDGWNDVIAFTDRFCIDRKKAGVSVTIFEVESGYSEVSAGVLSKKRCYRCAWCGQKGKVCVHPDQAEMLLPAIDCTTCDWFEVSF